MIDYSDAAQQREAEEELREKVSVELNAFIKNLHLMYKQERELKTLIDDLVTVSIACATCKV